VKPSRFEYQDPRSVPEALALLGEHGDEAKVLAGGQSLMPMLSMRLAYPSVLVDINGLDELRGIREQDDSIIFGALTRQAEAEDSALVARACPLLSEALPWVAHRSVRNRGTIGGSLAHADPAAEIPAVMTALEATVIARDVAGEREILIGDLFAFPLMSTLSAEELMVEIRVPRQPANAASAIGEVARRHGDFALAGVAATVLVGDDGVITSARLVSFATGPVPQRLRGAEAVLTGARPDRPLLEEAGRVAAQEIAPGDDLHASGQYRRAVTAVTVERTLAQGLTRAGCSSLAPEAAGYGLSGS